LIKKNATVIISLASENSMLKEFSLKEPIRLDFCGVGCQVLRIELLMGGTL